MHLLSALALAALASAVPTVINDPDALLKLRQTQGLNAAMVAAGREYVGTSLTIRSDNQENTLIRNEFGSITPENSMKWDATEPQQGRFSFGGADQVANYARQNRKHLRCHTLVWYSQLPQWVNSINNNATLMQVMTNHINTVMGRYKGQCNHWDVVNEALNEDGTLRDNVFLRVIGKQYIPIAFRIAAQADPAAKLYYNDYNLEYGEAKAKGAQQILKDVQAWGVKIDGIGLQGHLVSAPTRTQGTVTPSQEVLEQTLRLYTDLGVDVAYTELDIRMPMPTSAQKLQAQADAYQRVVASCIAVERCVGITIWGVSDRYSWVPSTFNGEGAALLWSDNYQKKPAYDGFIKGLSGSS
ncbi:hypothetical protein RB595_006893 [Gaeumannomyces hyphopodioides]